MALSCSRLAGNPPALVLFVTTQGKRPAFAGNLPGLCIQFRSDDARKIILRLLQQDPPRGRAAVRAALRRRAPALLCSPGATARAAAPAGQILLDRDFGAGFFELFLRGVGVGL